MSSSITVIDYYGSMFNNKTELILWLPDTIG